MKNTNIIITILGLFLMLSCTSVLDKEDFTAITPNDVWNSAEMIDAVINDIQGSLMPGWDYNASVSDEAPDPQGQMNDFLKGTATIDGWDHWYYTDIEKINQFLEKIKQTNFTEEIPAWEGQALFWRSWCYFNMVKGYGGVPLILEPQDPTNQESLFVKRSSTSACFEQIVKDLDKSIADLPDEWTGDNYGRIDKGAAMAFKGRVLLFWASPLFNPSNEVTRWQDAYEANKDAIDFLSGLGKGLLSDFSKIWTEEQNKEVIMLNQFYYPDHVYAQNSIRPLSYSRNAYGQCMPMLNTVNAFPMRDGSDFNPLTTAYDTLFMHRDDRFYATVAYNGCDYKIGELRDGEHLWIGRTSSDGMLEYAVHNPAEAYSYNITGFMNKKGLDPTLLKTTAEQATVDWIEIRYAEVLMNYGEAANEIGKASEALDVLYQIRARANILPGNDNHYGIKETTTEQIRERYIKECFVEFLFEGKRLDDLRRWKRFDIVNDQVKQYGIVSWLKSGEALPELTDNINQIWSKFEPRVVEVTPLFSYNWKDQYYFYAIPKRHLDGNPNLEQNNSWGGTFDPLQ
jgi:hypothetical protein